jgi:hypothetical protein
MVLTDNNLHVENFGDNPADDGRCLLPGLRGLLGGDNGNIHQYRRDQRNDYRRMGATGIAVAVRTIISHAVKRILAGAVGCWHRNFGSLLRMG